LTSRTLFKSLLPSNRNTRSGLARFAARSTLTSLGLDENKQALGDSDW
jgi:hypothetical protein